MLKINEVYNMDCANGIKLLDDKSIDLVVMDPPYLLQENQNWKKSMELLMLNSMMYYQVLNIFHSIYHMWELKTSLQKK